MLLTLHIGPHKTATSYIQENFSRNQSLLLKHGWLYPKVGITDRTAHHDLAHKSKDYLDSEGLHHQELAKLARSNRSAGMNLLFSGEGFCRWPAERFEQLSGLLEEPLITLVYAIRDPIDVFYSYWAEEVKHGRTTSLPERFCQNFNDPHRSRLLNPLVDLLPLIQRPNFRVKIILYELIKQTKLDIFNVICESALGISDIKPTITRHVNKSYEIELTEFLRVLTKRFANGKRFIGSGLRHRFVNETTETERNEIVQIVRNSSKRTRRSILVPRNAGFMRFLRQQLVKHLADLMVPAGNTENIFRNEKATLLYYDETELVQDRDVAARLNIIYERLAALGEIPVQRG